ncbi:hypothetical protein ABPG74_021703 [Tetrahymena malaccensis]
MEIQAIEHNELTVKFHFIENKNQEIPNLTLESKYHSFKADLKLDILVKGTCQLIYCSISPILTIVTIFLQNFVNVYYVTSTKNQVLISAFAVGTTFLNLFGYHVMFAFNNNLIALISQAHGAKDPYAVGIHFQRGLLFQFPLFIFLLIAIYLIDWIMMIFGQHLEQEVYLNAKQFVQWSAISVLLQGIYDVGRIYLCGQNHFGLPFYIKLVITFVNIFLADTLIDKYGLVGLAFAKNIGEFVGVILLYVFISKLDLRSWISPSIQMWTKWWDYFKFNFSGGLALYLHYLYMEILTVFVSNLNDKSALNAHFSFLNLRPLLFAIPLGTSVSVTSFVGQSIGENAKKKAQTASLMGVIACSIYFLIQMAFGYWLSEPLKQFLSISDENEVVQFDIIFNLYIFFIIYVESHQFMFTGIMKGCSQLKQNLMFYLVGFYFIGIPLVYFLGIFTSLRLQGIWISYLTSNVIVCIFQIMFFMRKDWDDFLKGNGVDLDKDFELPLIDFDNNKQIAESNNDNQQEETKLLQEQNYSPPSYDNAQYNSGSQLIKK